MSCVNYMVQASRTPVEVAQNFARHCKAKSLITRGMVKTGRTPRGIRGVVALKDIPTDTNVIVAPHMAFLSVFDAVRCPRFKGLWSGQVPFEPSQFDARVGSTFLQLHHVLLAYHMAHMMLYNDTEKIEELRYLDYLPRGESDYVELTKGLEQFLGHSDVGNDAAERIVKFHATTPAVVRATALYCLLMIFSRSIPVEHKATLERVMEKTDFVPMLEGEPATQTKYSVPILCPLLDMINHAADENVGIAIPDAELKHGRALVVRTCKPIKAGEELVMTYAGGDRQMLRFIYDL
jgi:hypothetical protein